MNSRKTTSMLRSSLGLAMASIIAASMYGCASGPNAHYVASQPTLETVKASPNQSQVYRNTLFTVSDFRADGSLKTFVDYDFTKESAPCTVLGSGYNSPAIQREESYTVKGNDNVSHTFICRNVGGPSEFRLVLAASNMDCKTRSWDPTHSVIQKEHLRAPECLKTGQRTTLNDQAEARYVASFGR